MFCPSLTPGGPFKRRSCHPMHWLWCATATIGLRWQPARSTRREVSHLLVSFSRRLRCLRLRCLAGERNETKGRNGRHGRMRLRTRGGWFWGWAGGRAPFSVVCGGGFSGKSSCSSIPCFPQPARRTAGAAVRSAATARSIIACCTTGSTSSRPPTRWACGAPPPSSIICTRRATRSGPIRACSTRGGRATSRTSMSARSAT